MPTGVADCAGRPHGLAALRSQAAASERAAFAQLYDLTRGHLLDLVVRAQRDRALAKDLLRKVCVNVWRCIEQRLWPWPTALSAPCRQ
jgi:DNA-directed RNA polymerase specialized sigma24 family protein